MMLMLRGARLQEAEGRGDDQWLATWYQGAAGALQENDEANQSSESEPDGDDEPDADEENEPDRQ